MPIKKAYDIIKDLPPNIQEMYEESLIRQTDISHFVEGTKEKAMAEGKAEGEVNTKIAIAKNLINKGMAPDEIAAMTGLSVTEIERLK